MKHTIFLLLMAGTLGLKAQTTPSNPVPGFDPERDPVAIRTDSTLFLTVSEYTLAQTVKARLGQGCQIFQISRSLGPDPSKSLLFEGILSLGEGQRFALNIPLIPDAQGQRYFASTQALLCSAPGCNNCSILNGNCVGCCANGTAVALPYPLGKVPFTPDK